MNNTYTMKTRPNILETGTPLFCDLYHLTMAQAWFLDGKAEDYKVSEAFFRKCPFGGSYLMTAGLGEFMQWLERWRFSKEDIESLKNDRNEDGSRIFNDEFLQFLEGQELKVTIRAVPEGELVFPNEPVYSVSGPNWQVELAEAALLNIFNAQSLIATKSSRICRAAQGKAVMEFGSRRAQGFDAAVLGARAAYIGGCAGTANVLADRVYQTPALGTMAHSWVQMFDSEFDAFKAYALRYPRDCTLLVDTYSTLKSGVPNAIRVFKEVLAPLGYRPSGIRIDSGDITYLSKKARKMLDEAGFPDCKICASNSLDEYLIRDMFLQGAPIDLFGVGERLITASSEPVFGGVYKLAAVEKDGEIVPKIKISDNVSKITTPCFKDLYRLYDRASGKAIADVVTLFGEEIDDQKPYELFDPQYTWKRKTVTDFRARKLRVQLFKNGKPVYQSPALAEIKKNCALQLETLWDEVKRFENPHNYYVDLSQRLWEHKEALIKKNKV